MKKRIFCIAAVGLVMSIYFSMIAMAANTEKVVFPHAIVYSTIKDVGLDKKVQAAEVIEYETGRIILDTNINEKYNPEGKDVILMAVYTALSVIKADSVNVAEGAVTDTRNNVLGLKAGMDVAVLDVVAAALFNNDVNSVNTLALAADSTMEDFVMRMNRTASYLGMIHSNFTNASGKLDPNQYTTVSDMSVLAANCYNNQTITDITSSELHYIRTDEVLKIKKTLNNPFELVNSASEFFNRSVFGIGVSKDSKGVTTSLVTYITSRQKYVIVLRSNDGNAYNSIIDTLDYVKKNYALVDISKIIFELCEKTMIEIGGEKIFFNPMKNTLSNGNVVVNMFYSKSVSNLSDEYTIKSPEELPGSVKVGDVIKGFKIFYKGNQISSINLMVKSIGEPEKKETTLGFTIYQSSDVQIRERSFMEEHSWVVLVGIVLVVGAVLIIGVNNLRNI